jgi:hypothetical protein
MTATTTDTTTQTGEEPGSSNSGQAGGAPPAQQQGGITFTADQQAHIDRLIADRLARQKATIEGQTRAEREKAERDAAEREAKELGEWKTVAETHEAHVKELEGQLAKKDRDLLATRIAAKHQLPETLAARLMGDDADALEADATALAKLIEKPAAVPPSSGSPANGARPNNGAPLKREDLKNMDWQQITKLKDEGKLNHLLEGQPR